MELGALSKSKEKEYITLYLSVQNNQQKQPCYQNIQTSNLQQKNELGENKELKSQNSAITHKYQWLKERYNEAINCLIPTYRERNNLSIIP